MISACLQCELYVHTNCLYFYSYQSTLPNIIAAFKCLEQARTAICDGYSSGAALHALAKPCITWLYLISYKGSVIHGACVSFCAMPALTVKLTASMTYRLSPLASP